MKAQLAPNIGIRDMKSYSRGTKALTYCTMSCNVKSTIMVRVESISQPEGVRNPQNGQVTPMVKIRFIESGGRAGINKSLSDTSDFLSRAMGENVGLEIIRTHTHAVLAEKAHLFSVGQEIAGFINRELFSEGQMRQQEGVEGRMIEGKLTYVTTKMEDLAKDDLDHRKDEALVAQMNPEGIARAVRGGAVVAPLRPEDANNPQFERTGVGQPGGNAPGTGATETLQLGKTGA